MLDNEDARYLCVVCGGYVDHRRYALGYKTCLQCGEAAAKDESRRKASMVQITLKMSDLSVSKLDFLGNVC